MKYFIRTDASEKLGVGHVMRCLALSRGLIDKDQEVIFICRDVDPFISELINNTGCSILQIETTKFCLGSLQESEYIIQLINKEYTIVSEDWLIIDHYSIDYIFEGVLRKLFANIMVIDDLADRYHDCDILLDASLADSKKRYNSLVPHSAIKLLGPEYALLRQEFAFAREALVVKQKKNVENIFVCFGGTDPTNETLKIIRALEPCLNDLNKVKIILGKMNPHIEGIIRLYEGKSNKLEFFIQPSSIALEMSSSDLAICAGGSMTWERYCLGLPGIVIAIADNQLEVAQQGHALGLDEFVGSSHFIVSEDITQTIRRIINSKIWLKNARQKAMLIVDGKGVSRVVDILTTKVKHLELRDVGPNDFLWMWECRNEVESRNNSIHTEEISLDEHIKWMEQSNAMANRKLMVAWNGDQKIAVVRLDKDHNNAMVSINVAKEHRGKGNALKILRELEVTAKQWDSIIHTLQATIKKGNINSIKTFIKAGYKECSSNDRIIIVQKKITI